MSQRVDGKAILELLAKNEQEVAKVYRYLAEDAKFGDMFFEIMAKDEDRHHDVYLNLAKQAEADGGWVVEKRRLRLFPPSLREKPLGEARRARRKSEKDSRQDGCL